ncbi:MAG: hypothetical protein ACTSQ8_01890 [Candidatus Helarchaeota archaeon]
MPTDNDRWIALLAYMELSVDRGNFTAIYLLSNEGTVIQREEAPNFPLNFEPLRNILLHTITINPNFSEIILHFPEQTIVIQPLKPMIWKDASAAIPEVSYLLVAFPPTRTFRKALNKLVRNLLEPFKVNNKKATPQKDTLDPTTKRRLAEQILRDLEDL